MADIPVQVCTWITVKGWKCFILGLIIRDIRSLVLPSVLSKGSVVEGNLLVKGLIRRVFSMSWGLGQKDFQAAMGNLALFSHGQR